MSQFNGCAEKPNGELRVCLDLRDLNKDIKREHYQLPRFENCEQIEQSKSLYQYTFFYKNIVYRNIQAQIGQKVKNILRISSALVLAIDFVLFFSKIFLINRTLLI